MMGSVTSLSGKDRWYDAASPRMARTTREGRYPAAAQTRGLLVTHGLRALDSAGSSLGNASSSVRVLMPVSLIAATSE